MACDSTYDRLINGDQDPYRPFIPTTAERPVCRRRIRIPGIASKSTKHDKCHCRSFNVIVGNPRQT